MSLLEVFASWVEKQPQKVLYSYLNDNGAVVKSFTYSELNESSDRLAAHLRQNNLHYGDRVLLVYPPSLDFVVSFYACLKAGLIAVPVFPPDPSRLNKDLPMFSAIARYLELM